MDTAFIEQYESALRSAMLTNDVDALDDLLDDDLVFTAPNGDVISKEADLFAPRTKLLRLDTLNIEQPQAHPLGAMILTTPKARLVGSLRAIPIDGTLVLTTL